MSLAITKARANRFGSTKTTEVYNRTNGRCAYCGVKLQDNATGKEDHDIFTLDHILPISKGGTRDISNLRSCCKRCNNLKGGNDNIDYLRMRLLIDSGKMTRFTERQFEYLYKRGINLGKIHRYEFYYEKIGVK